MTEEERRAKNCEKSKRYREKHADDPKFKARVANTKRKWCAENKEKLRRQKRERYHTNPQAKAVAIASGLRWKENNPERWQEAQDAWRLAHKEEIKEYSRQYHKKKKLISETADRREKRLEKRRCYYKKNAKKVIAATKLYIATHSGFNAKNCASRRAQRNKSMPSWADRSAIAALYREAKRLTRETGIVHHVDHIIPLKHKLVCGLHVSANLQILPGVDNMKKSNRFSVDHVSP